LSGFLRLARLDRLFIVAMRFARWEGWGNAGTRRYTAIDFLRTGV